MSSLKIEPDQSQNAATTLDDFLGGRIRIAQPKQGHRAGSDAVWLQAAVAAKPGDKVLDAGAGVGVAGLCLLARCPQIHVTAVDIDEGAVALAEANAQLNAYAAQFRAITLDLTAPAETLIAKGLVREGYDQVMANPPFHVEGTVRPAPDAGRAAAHVMEAGALEVLGPLPRHLHRAEGEDHPDPYAASRCLSSCRCSTAASAPSPSSRCSPRTASLRSASSSRRGKEAAPACACFPASCCTRPTDATRQRPRRCCGMDKRLSSAISQGFSLPGRHVRRRRPASPSWHAAADCPIPGGVGTLPCPCSSG